MLANTIITYIMAAFAMLGAIDRIIGNKLGLGKKFEQAFFAMGPLVLSMVGMLVLAPVIAKVLSPVVTPLFSAVGADPAVFAGIFLAIDMGGAPLAKEMAMNPQSAELAGIIIGSMLGATIVFNIPVALEISREDGNWIARGMIAGLITIPMMESMKDMDPRGKVLNSAFCVSGAFLLGDHFGYAAAYDPPMLIPLLVGKLAAGITAILLALLMTRSYASCPQESDNIQESDHATDGESK